MAALCFKQSNQTSVPSYHAACSITGRCYTTISTSLWKWKASLPSRKTVTLLFISKTEFLQMNPATMVLLILLQIKWAFNEYPNNLRNLWLNRQELTARDFGSAESAEIGGILYVFPNFSTARMGQKTRRSAVADLFRGSLTITAIIQRIPNGLSITIGSILISSASKSMSLRKLMQPCCLSS